ncbi:hypothetical protein LguiB_020609 [Lonicera macranthoides]
MCENDDSEANLWVAVLVFLLKPTVHIPLAPSMCTPCMDLHQRWHGDYGFKTVGYFQGSTRWFRDLASVLLGLGYGCLRLGLGGHLVILHDGYRLGVRFEAPSYLAGLAIYPKGEYAQGPFDILSGVATGRTSAFDAGPLGGNYTHAKFEADRSPGRTLFGLIIFETLSKVEAARISGRTLFALIATKSFSLVGKIAPIIHEWTYDAMCHDLLSMEGNKYVHEVQSKIGGLPKMKEVLLDDHDHVWLELHHAHIAYASERLHMKMTSLMSNNEAAQIHHGSRLS